MPPVIGITCDLEPRSGRAYQLIRAEYAQAVVQPGGTPLLLSHEIGAIDDYLRLCDGFIFSGGDDPDTTPFGEAVHLSAKLIAPARQAFELALLQRLDSTHHPVLGICLGMQLMALHHGGRLHQHLPDVLPPEVAARHAGGNHTIQSTSDNGSILPGAGMVYSHHHQAVADPGRMRVCAVCDQDDVIEAVDLPGERLYLGVQWHPERLNDPATGAEIFRQLVNACRR